MAKLPLLLLRVAGAVVIGLVEAVLFEFLDLYFRVDVPTNIAMSVVDSVSWVGPLRWAVILVGALVILAIIEHFAGGQRKQNKEANRRLYRKTIRVAMQDFHFFSWA